MTSPVKAPQAQPAPPSRKTLLLLTAGSAALAALVVFGAVLPAEYNKDPLGIGRATGLSRLWAPQDRTVASGDGGVAAAQAQPAPFRSDTFEIDLAANGDAERKNALEFKVRMKKGAAMVYAWTTAGLPADGRFLSDFHGHTVAAPGASAPVDVADYEKAIAHQANGSLAAPMDGIHGWYFRNRSDAPIKVRVKLSGFYELIPPGEGGNLAGVQPVAPGT